MRWLAMPGHEATVLTGASASETSLKSQAPGQTVIHLATHGFVAGDTCLPGPPGQRGVGGIAPVVQTSPGRTEIPASAPSPWLSRRVWLALAGANRARDHHVDENEGLLTAEEVLTLDLAGTDWVVLSACHSGLAEAWSREGMLGMRRAFDLAGARTVIASQWAVEDEATREWMQVLYAARAGGAASPAVAIEAAGRAILSERRRAGRSTHPFYWGAFTASGE
jgi:CHAT domain-containing protein